MQFRADYLREHVDLSSFSDVFFSCDTGHIKRNEEAFFHVIAQGKLDSNAYIFIDDDRQNIRIAKRVGMHTILYSDPGQLEENLREFGIP